MKFSFECDFRIFKILSFSFVTICISIIFGILISLFFDYDYFKKKLEYKNDFKQISKNQINI